MATYIILSRLAHDAVAEPDGFRELADRIAQRIKQDCGSGRPCAGRPCGSACR